MKKKIVNILLILIPLVFYLFFAFYDGVVFGPDSTTYINFVGNREPLYPLFISLIKTITSGSDYYLNVVVIIQSILWAVSAWLLVKYIKEEYQTNNIITYLLIIIILIVSSMLRFVSKRKAIYSNCILSEGLVYPLFIMYFTNNLKYLINKDTKSLVKSIVLCMLLVATRKQMYLSLFLLIISMIYVLTIRKEKLIKYFSIIFVAGMVLLVNSLIDVGYMYASKGVANRHTGDNRFISTMIFYTANDEDVNYILDDDSRELFKNVYEICKSNGYLEDDSINGLYNRVKHFSDNYDNIQIDTILPVFEEYAKSKTTNNVELLVDLYNKEIISSLLFKKLGSIVRVIFESFLVGLAITISADRKVFLYYSFVAYTIYIILLIKTIQKNGIDNKYSLFGLLTIISIVLNNAIVSAVIFNQTRYTFYNMPLFYMTGLVILYNVIRKKRV